MRAYERKVNQLKDLIIRKYKSAYDKSKEMDIDISSMTYLPEPDVFNVMYTEHMSVILDRVPHKRYRIWFIASDCSDARVEGLRQGREDKINGFEFTSQTRDKIRRLITDTSGLRSHRFLYDKEDDKKQRSTENRLFKKYACRDWDGRGSTQWKSFPTQSPICRGNDGLPFNVDNLTIPYGKWRKESIKAYGNAIVPLIAVKIFEMINKIEGYEQQTTL